MRKYIVLFLLIISLIIKGQEKEKVDSAYAQPKLVLKTDNLGVFGLGLEFQLKNNVTISSFVGYDWSVGKNTLIDKWHYKFTPRVQGDIKYYYNFSKRIKNAKRLDYYSGNYLSLAHNTVLCEKAIFTNSFFETAPVNVIGVIHGWQRTFGKRFYFEGAIGPGIGYGKYFRTPFFVPYIKLRLGVNLTLKN